MTDTYYEESYPPSVWGGTSGTVNASSAIPGTPGNWLPAGSRPPANLADLQAGKPNAVTANPATPWVGLTYMQTMTQGAAGQATWTGTGWVGGRAPAAQARRARGASQEPQEASEAPEATDVAQEAPEGSQG